MQRPGVSRVVDGDGVGGETIEIGVGFIYGRMNVLPNIDASSCGCNGRERRSGALSLSDGNAYAEEFFLKLFRSHWNERKIERMSEWRQQKAQRSGAGL